MKQINTQTLAKEVGLPSLTDYGTQCIERLIELVHNYAIERAAALVENHARADVEMADDIRKLKMKPYVPTKH